MPARRHMPCLRASSAYAYDGLARDAERRDATRALIDAPCQHHYLLFIRAAAFIFMTPLMPLIAACRRFHICPPPTSAADADTPFHFVFERAATPLPPLFAAIAACCRRRRY